MSPSRRARVSQALLALAGISFFAGCKGFETTGDIGYCSVKAKQTRVYLFAPGKSSSADPILTQGQRVVMLRREFGFSRVMTAAGEKGYVATDDLEPAPMMGTQAPAGPGGVSPAVAPRFPRGSGSPGISSANRSVIEAGPLFGGSDPLLPPLPRDPAHPGASGGSPRPTFRVGVPPQLAPDPEKKPSGD